MNCKSCGEPISKDRLEANPSATECVSCLKSKGDVPRVKGLMVWSHKTAPEIQFITDKQAIEVQRFSRKGVHAQLPMSSRSGEPLSSSNNLGNSSGNFEPSRCHPDRPRVSPSGKCLECSLSWYSLRSKHGSVR